MSLHDYEASREMGHTDQPFYGLIMAAMRRADDDNLAVLVGAWPEVYDELDRRYNARGGLLPGEHSKDGLLRRLEDGSYEERANPSGRWLPA